MGPKYMALISLKTHMIWKYRGRGLAKCSQLFQTRMSESFAKI